MSKLLSNIEQLKNIFKIFGIVAPEQEEIDAEYLEKLWKLLINYYILKQEMVLYLVS